MRAWRVSILFCSEAGSNRRVEARDERRLTGAPLAKPKRATGLPGIRENADVSVVANSERLRARRIPVMLAARHAADPLSASIYESYVLHFRLIESREF